jgi:hypothetical protein
MEIAIKMELAHHDSAGSLGDQDPDRYSSAELNNQMMTEKQGADVDDQDAMGLDTQEVEDMMQQIEQQDQWPAFEADPNSPNIQNLAAAPAAGGGGEQLPRSRRGSGELSPQQGDDMGGATVLPQPTQDRRIRTQTYTGPGQDPRIKTKSHNPKGECHRESVG